LARTSGESAARLYSKASVQTSVRIAGFFGSNSPERAATSCVDGLYCQRPDAVLADEWNGVRLEVVLHEKALVARHQRVDRQRRVEARHRAVARDLVVGRAAHIERLAVGERDQRLVDLAAVGAGSELQALLELRSELDVLGEDPGRGLGEECSVDVRPGLRGRGAPPLCMDEPARQCADEHDTENG
jgi:hypothetical protein